MRSPKSWALSALLILAGSVTAQSSPADIGFMNQSALVSELLGTTIEGIYQDGAPFTEHLGGDRTTWYTDNQSSGRGTITFEGDVICFTYNLADVGVEEWCFRVLRRARNCFEFHSAERVDPTIRLDFGILEQNWVARASRSHMMPDCPQDVVS